MKNTEFITFSESKENSISKTEKIMFSLAEIICFITMVSIIITVLCTFLKFIVWLLF